MKMGDEGEKVFTLYAAQKTRTRMVISWWVNLIKVTRYIDSCENLEIGSNSSAPQSNELISPDAIENPDRTRNTGMTSRVLIRLKQKSSVKKINRSKGETPKCDEKRRTRTYHKLCWEEMNRNYYSSIMFTLIFFDQIVWKSMRFIRKKRTSVNHKCYRSQMNHHSI